MTDVDLAEDIHHAWHHDLRFRREWERYAQRDRWARDAYARLSPTIDMRYEAA